MMPIAVVWLKRDLRLSDHEPLMRAIESGLPVLLIYCFEPMLMTDPHYSARHWQFVAQSLLDIKQRLPEGALYCSTDDALKTLTRLQQDYQINTIYSHQEVGLQNTFERDKAVAYWCRQQKIEWCQSQFGAVHRGLSHRGQWDKDWQKVMRQSLCRPALDKAKWVVYVNNNAATDILADYYVSASSFQSGGETFAHQTMENFFDQRGKQYAYSLSSPLLSQIHCTRLSAYLAWGNISLRQIYQMVLNNWSKQGWRRSLSALSSRLHWHCHFIQKFESEADMEFRSVNRGYSQLPCVTGDLAQQRLSAWKRGMTGIPMVDACMRCLAATGYINFRMRAMLVSMLCHHLAVDWREGVSHLASYFLDFEPGIHYSQFQMQAGVTGINTIRIYNPVKQGEEKDSDGEFVKHWLPELAEVPAPLIHSPWQLSAMDQLLYGVELGKDYPLPIVDLKQSYKEAQQLLWHWRKVPAVQLEAKRLLNRHVRLI